MNLTVNSFWKHSKLFMFLVLVVILFLAGILFRVKIKQPQSTLPNIQDTENSTEYPTNATAPNETRRKEYLYRLLTNTTRSLIQMEIKARRLEENMRRIKERTADLLWKNKDKALWHILFKNISRHISIRHGFHQHSSLKRIMQDTHSHPHKHKAGRRKVLV